MLAPITEKEKDQILELLKHESLEEGVIVALRHMNKRCEEAGEEQMSIIVLEKLALRFNNAYSTSAISHEIR